LQTPEQQAINRARNTQQRREARKRLQHLSTNMIQETIANVNQDQQRDSTGEFHLVISEREQGNATVPIISSQLVEPISRSVFAHIQSSILPFYRIARAFLPNVTYFNVGSMTKECNDCSALHYQKECVGSMCCSQGKVRIPLCSDPPAFLKHLLSGESVESNRFLKKIRAYNTALSFASFGADIVSGIGGGPTAFKIHGTFYHHLSSVAPRDGSRSNFAQLFLLDDMEATNERINFP
jgi:hypothetical protein